MKIKKTVKKLKRIFDNSIYLKHLNKPLKQNTFLLEAGQGKHINGNIFALLKVLEYDDEYNTSIPYLVIDEAIKEKVELKLKKYSFNKTKLVIRRSKEYNILLATAKYLITDNTFPYYFIKRKDQVYLNTWHGTPLKCLGRSDIENSISIGNVQKNFLVSDYLLFPNEYTKETMMSDYMVERLYNGKAVTIDYPRNDALFHNEMHDEIIDKYDLAGKRVLAYMPTWRGIGRNVDMDKQLSDTLKLLTSLEASLKNDEMLYVNFHFLIDDKLDLNGFEKIRKFPEEYETYDFLSVCDTLITDYSSVMFDFAQTGKSVLLYVYDVVEYRNEKGFYFDIESLPFVQVKTIDALAEAIHTGSEDYVLPKQFIGNHFGTSARCILDLMCNNNSEGLTINDMNAIEDLKVVHFGDITKESTVSLLQAYLAELTEEEKKKTVISFDSSINEKSVSTLNTLDADVHYLRIMSGNVESFFESIQLTLNNVCGLFKKAVNVFCDREYNRLFSNISNNSVHLKASNNKKLINILEINSKKNQSN